MWASGPQAEYEVWTTPIKEEKTLYRGFKKPFAAKHGRQCSKRSHRYRPLRMSERLVSAASFAKLPAEIRIIVCKHIVVQEETFNLHYNEFARIMSRCRFREMSSVDDLNLTTKPELLQFLIEARYEFWTQNRFHTALDPMDIASINSSYGVRHLRHLEILDAYYSETRWRSFEPNHEIDIKPVDNIMCNALDKVLRQAKSLRTLKFTVMIDKLASTDIASYPVWPALRNAKNLREFELVVSWVGANVGKLEPLVNLAASLREDMMLKPERTFHNPIWTFHQKMTEGGHRLAFLHFHDRSDGQSLLDIKSETFRSLIAGEVGKVLQSRTGPLGEDEPTEVCLVDRFGVLHPHSSEFSMELHAKFDRILREMQGSYLALDQRRKINTIVREIRGRKF